MFAAIGNKLGCGLLNLLRNLAVPVRCPKCGFQFKPFADHTFTRFSEIMGRFPCPKCGKHFGIGEDAKSARDAGRFNPPGPFTQPASSRIERSMPSVHELLFYIPPSGRGGALLAMAILWNGVILTIAISALMAVLRGGLRPPVGAAAMVSVFVLVGLGIAYAAVRQKYASHLLYLSPDTVRMQRLLLFRSTYDLKPEEILHVKLVEFYTQNDLPITGIEIGGGLRQIRFGSALEDDEKNWLAWEIRNFLLQHGALQLAGEDAVPESD